jgi:hypothetical protein
MITFEVQIKAVHMSKKRKTRKQKEVASTRHIYPHVHTLETPVYSIGNIAVKQKEITPVTSTRESVSEKDIAYLRHDITLITAASGIIVAFNLLLFVLLTRGVIHLPVFGY